MRQITGFGFIKGAMTVSLLALLPLASFSVPATAAGMSGNTTMAQKTVGMYRLLLQIGPAENMSMHAGGKGERMLGGKDATCKMSGMHMGGMSASAPEAAGEKSMMKACNHHVELHVYNAHTAKVVRNARVSITMYNAQMRMGIMVPVMTMVGQHMGMGDFHYGNNVYAPAGKYTVTVHVNNVAAKFNVHLM